MGKSIVIIGSGLGGLAAGIYGQMNGFKTRIFEMSGRPGGQCATWQRGGYLFDACIHHLMGCSPKSRIYRFWSEIGAMPVKRVYPRECVSVASEDGKRFEDYYDLQKLEKHLLRLSPGDSKVIREYVGAIRLLSKHDLMGDLIFGGMPAVIRSLPLLIQNGKWFRTSMSDFANRFTDPFLRRAFPLLVYSAPSMPVFAHLMRHAAGCNRDIAWPVGASRAFIASIVNRYESLGGKIEYSSKVSEILVKDGKAAGVKLENGREEPADFVLSDADGRKTLQDMLGGKFMDDRLKAYCAQPEDETNWAVHVFLGVNRDLSKEPSSLVLLLDNPVTIAGHRLSSLEMQIYGFDKTMAPEGKGAIKVELVSSYSYWRKLAENKQAYEDEKQKVAGQVIGLLEKHFEGITGQVETADVPTLLTWERFMGGTHGFANGPAKKFSPAGLFRGSDTVTVPGLENFYFTGVWATSMGATFVNALSGKKAIQTICKREHIRFHCSNVR